MTEIQRADVQLRRRIVGLLVLLLLVSGPLALALRLYERQISQWFAELLLRLADQPVTLVLLGLLFVSPLLILGAFLFRNGTAVIRGERMPPRGHAVIRDTNVLTGVPAIRRGRIIQCAALILIALVLAIPVVFLKMVQSLV